MPKRELFYYAWDSLSPLPLGTTAGCKLSMMTGRCQVRHVAIVAMSLILGACVGTRTTTMSGEQSHSLQGKSLAVTTRAKPDFGAMTPGKAMFAMVGAFAMISAGNKIVAENAIEDPANAMGEQLRQALMEKDGLVSATGQESLATTTDTAKLATQYAYADYVLDVQTINWSFIYRPNLGTQHYRVIYSVKVRLIDTHKASLLAEGFCVRKDDNDPNPPTHDELLANHAEILKAKLKADASECVGELKQKILGSVT